MNYSIAIIGAAGTRGAGFARALAGKGHRLILSDNNAPKLAETMLQLFKLGLGGALTTAHTEREAAWEADIIVLATPLAKQESIAKNIRGSATCKIVISITNPASEAGSLEFFETQRSAAEELARLLPDSFVVKAFSTIAPDFAHGAAADAQTVCFIAGDDTDAVETVCDLARGAGLLPVFVGDLTQSRSLETMMVLFRRIALRYPPHLASHPA